MLLKKKLDSKPAQKSSKTSEEQEMINEYLQTENYLLEICEEFKLGMKENFRGYIDFKDVDNSMKFNDRFQNFLFNLLLIIDHQKTEIQML